MGEAVALRLCDVDLEERILRVEQIVEEVSGQVRVVPELKSSASRRRFAIPQVLADEIAAHIERHRPDAGPDDLLFVGSRGGVMRRSFSGWTFEDAVRRAGLPETLNFHGLRHVATSLMVANSEHPRVIQHRLGHTDRHISMSVHAHVSPELDAQAAARLDAVIGGAPTDRFSRRSSGESSHAS